MSKPFDATLKELFELNPVEWAHFVGHPASEAKLIDADVSTVTASSDKVIQVQEDPPWLLHVELQSSPDQSVPRRCFLYHALLDYRHNLLVRSVVILLRRQANLRNLTGLHERAFPEEASHLTFRYRRIRMWEQDVNQVLNSGLSLIPLAPLCDNAVEQIETVLDAIEERFKTVEPESRRNDLWVATSVLMGLRYERPFIQQLFQRIAGMEDSVTYQMIIEKGAEKARGQTRREDLLLLGKEKLGEPTEDTVKTIEDMQDDQRLSQLLVRILRVSTWEELLQENGGE